MGRESRQARRARERRQIQHNRGRAPQSGTNWRLIAIVAGIIALGVLAAGVVFANSASSSSSKSNDPLQNIPTPVPGKTIKGIKCDPNEQVTYHVHAHIAIIASGKTVEPPQGIGIDYNHDCLYWLHTHNPDGIIHIEAPTKVTPALGDFFDIWHQPLSRTQVWKYKAPAGTQLTMYVNGKKYNGDPRAWKLHRHDVITIEVGKPLVKPKGYNFGNL